jgi:hypothetical protein
MRASTASPTLTRVDDRAVAAEAVVLRRPGALGVSAAVVAVLLGVASAGISLFWALGGHALIDTMGGSTERWGRDRGVMGVVALLGWTVVKLAVAVATLAAVGAFGERPPTRWLRPGAWLVAAQLAVYGGLLTIGGLLVETRLVDPADSADRHAITWHALLWDPWTAVWGVALAVALWCTRPRSRQPITA